MTLDCTCNRLKEAEAKAAKWDAIVRCRECKHYFDWVYDVPMCDLWADGDKDSISRTFPRVRQDGFCAWGERRES